MIARKTFHDSGVTAYATGGIDEAHIGWVADMAWQSTAPTGMPRKPPPGFWDTGNPLASWNNEVTRAVLDDEIAVGLYVGPSGSVPAEPSGAVIARRQAGSGADFVVLYAASNFDSETSLPGLMARAREVAAEKGGRLVTRVDIPARVEFHPA